jgi:hypothetical protein
MIVRRYSSRESLVRVVCKEVLRIRIWLWPYRRSAKIERALAAQRLKAVVGDADAAGLKALP